MSEKLRIALLLGGTSSEKIISKRSSKSIYIAIKDLGYDCKLVNPAYGTNQPENPDDFFEEEDKVEISNRNYIEAINSKLFDGVDLAFLGLHGRWGEDGTIQSLLELRGIKYTGSKILASSLAMDKAMSKIVFQHSGVQTPEWFVVDKNPENPESVIRMIENNFGFPAILKPNDQGSTVGMTICKSVNEVKDALALSFQFSNKTVVEEYIQGRELTVTILEDKALPVLEIKPKSGFYDYDSKYTTGKSEYIVPADISQETTEKVQQQSLLAFNVLGCEIYGRVDFRMNEKLDLFCLEVNTLPGMTSLSLVPKMAAATGISFEQLIERIIRLSL
jgi:D-alanine-D-alanine ligase